MNHKPLESNQSAEVKSPDRTEGNGPTLVRSDAGRDWLPPDEESLVREALQSVLKVRYGSVVLVVHDGHVVEVSKTVRIRRTLTGNGKEKDKR